MDTAGAITRAAVIASAASETSEAEAAVAAAAEGGDLGSPFAILGRDPDRGKDAVQHLRGQLLRASYVRPAAAGSGSGGVPGGGQHLPMPPPPTSYVHIHGFVPRASRGPGAAAVLGGIVDVADHDGGDDLAVTGWGRQEATSSWAWMPSPRRWASASMGSSTASATASAVWCSHRRAVPTPPLEQASGTSTLACVILIGAVSMYRG